MLVSGSIAIISGTIVFPLIVLILVLVYPADEFVGNVSHREASDDVDGSE